MGTHNKNMSTKQLAHACISLNNANQAKKRQCLIRNVNTVVVRFFELMQKHGYIDDLILLKDKRTQKLLVKLNGRLNKCAAISPNYDLQVKDLERFRSSILPARQFGHMILHTSHGIKEHGEIMGVSGGKVLG